MSFSDVDRILELVWDMDIDVNMYLSGELAPSAMICRILEICRRIRERAGDDTAMYEIEGLECAAKEISRLPEEADAPRRQGSPGPDESQLMKGLFDLRAQLMKTGDSIH